MHGVRIVECGEGVSAPFCTRVLADLGAEVWKVEPAEGDVARTWGPFPEGTIDGEASAMFGYLNAGKKSVRLTGEPNADNAIVSSLTSHADVFVTNLLSPAQNRLGVDIDAVGRERADLISIQLSPYGASGPWAGMPGQGINVCAASGISVILGEPGRTPLSFPAELPGLQAGLHGAGAVLAALLSRLKSGNGHWIDVSEADVLAYYAGGMSLFILGSGGDWMRRGFERHGGIYPSGFYPCGDGFIFLATQTRAQWSGFLELMGDPEWAKADPVFQDGVAIGFERAEEVDLHFIPWLLEHTRAELAVMAREANLVLGPINEPPDVLASSHLEEREFWTTARMGGADLRIPGMGYRLSETPYSLGPIPRLGEHGEIAPVDASSSEDVPAVPGPRRTRPLAGYRAVEFGFNWAGPMVGQILADMGMEVIKVETAGRLDFMRHWKHARRFFHNANRSKLSVSVDVKKPEGRELVLSLVRESDLVFDNFAAGVMERLRLGYDDLRGVKQDIIGLSMAMAGQTGPLRHLRGFATIATGFAGIENAIGYAETGPTGLPVIGLGDANAAIQGVVSALAALHHRERTGQGQAIDLSQIEAATTLSGALLARHQFDPSASTRPQGNQHDRMVPHGIYPTSGDDRWISLAVDSDEEWVALVGALEAPSWAMDATLATAEGRRTRRSEIDEQLAAWTAGHERDALVERLAVVGLAVAPVLGIEELTTWPQFAARGLVEELPSFEGERETVYRTPWHLSETPDALTGPSPRVGEHNEYVFKEVLGLGSDRVEELVAQEVIH
ncbi:MAG: CoA transferase [Candidatus Binatia bacterium]|nr:CoA transferase [Candidatus Binatia bacterium]